MRLAHGVAEPIESHPTPSQARSTHWTPLGPSERREDNGGVRSRRKPHYIKRERIQPPTGAVVNAVANRYWPGLFHCYDNPDIPRNNNDLEREFSRFKRTERKATGRRSTAGGPLETCAEFLLEAWDAIIAMPDLATFLKDVTPDQLKAAMKEMERLSETARTKRRINRDPEGFLSDRDLGTLPPGQGAGMGVTPGPRSGAPRRPVVSILDRFCRR